MKASSDYTSKIFQTNESVTESEDDIMSGPQYNWPYDFFSLVELVKIDASVTLRDPNGAISAQGQGNTPQGSKGNRRSDLKKKG
jgi:hypothetical protein